MKLGFHFTYQSFSSSCSSRTSFRFLSNLIGPATLSIFIEIGYITSPVFFASSISLSLNFLLVIFKSLRSEEHTSELQSRFDLVCCLLLEKKKRTLSL